MGRTVSLGVLEQVRVASPCSMRWEHMEPLAGAGDGDRVRHCGSCRLHVFNLSGMSRPEAEALVLSSLGSGDRLCIRMHVRADGTIMTRDCPTGLRAAKARLVRAVSRLAAAVGLFTAGGVLARARERLMNAPGLSRAQPFATLCDWVRPPSVPVQTLTVQGEAFIMGKMVAPRNTTP